jgi:hypothetical protein
MKLCPIGPRNTCNLTEIAAVAFQRHSGDYDENAQDVQQEEAIERESIDRSNHLAMILAIIMKASRNNYRKGQTENE